MNIYVAQIYIEVGVNFNFSHLFQSYLHSVLSKNTIPSCSFIEKFEGFDLMFRMSAKLNINDNEIKGPTIFKKDKDIEYSIFLPFDIIMQNSNYHYWALKYLFNGIFSIYEKYSFEFSYLKNNEEDIIKEILSDPEMFYPE